MNVVKHNKMHFLRRGLSLSSINIAMASIAAVSCIDDGSTAEPRNHAARVSPLACTYQQQAHCLQ